MELGVWNGGGMVYTKKWTLPEAFHERCMHELGRESGGPSLPQKKIEFRIGVDAISNYTSIHIFIWK